MKKLIMLSICAAAVCMNAMAAQCTATNKKGTRCKREASANSEYCMRHAGTTKVQRAAGADAGTTRAQSAVAQTNSVSAGRCQANTKSGARCKRKAQPESKFCSQHSVEGDASAEPTAMKKSAKGASTEAATASDGQGTGAKKNGKASQRKATPGKKKSKQNQN